MLCNLTIRIMICRWGWCGLTVCVTVKFFVIRACTAHIKSSKLWLIIFFPPLEAVLSASNFSMACLISIITQSLIYPCSKSCLRGSRWNLFLSLVWSASLLRLLLSITGILAFWVISISPFPVKRLHTPLACLDNTLFFFYFILLFILLFLLTSSTLV